MGRPRSVSPKTGEKQLEYQRVWREKNLPRALEYGRKYREKYREKLRAKFRAWYELNKVAYNIRRSRKNMEKKHASKTKGKGAQ